MRFKGQSSDALESATQRFGEVAALLRQSALGDDLRMELEAALDGKDEEAAAAAPPAAAAAGEAASEPPKAPLETKVAAAAAVVARKTGLTEEAAKPVAQAVLTKAASNKAAATTLAQQLSGLTGSIDLQLSNPTPLAPLWRGIASGLMVALMATALAIVATNSGSKSISTASDVVLAVLGGLAWLGLVLFVMGYKNVTLSGSSGSGGSGGGGSGGSAGGGSAGGGKAGGS